MQELETPEKQFQCPEYTQKSEWACWRKQDEPSGIAQAVHSLSCWCNVEGATYLGEKEYSPRMPQSLGLDLF